MKKPAFCVAICTTGRAGDMLVRAVESVFTQDAGPDSLEVLVVDNSAQDEKGAKIKNLLAPWPSVRIVQEPAVGLSFARNRALDKALAPVVVFIDDDAKMEAGYLKRLAKVFSGSPLPAAAGGPVLVGWNNPPPPWWEPGLNYYANYLNLGEGTKKIVYPQVLYGTNLAVDRQLALGLGGFDTNLGRIGEGLLDGEDALMQLCMTRQSKRPIIYDSGLVVTHYLAAERINWNYLLKKAFWHGCSRRMMEAKKPE
ncbi:MAG: glycosyltransferase, partial [Desulfatibacillaceae bacterium]|nr:glycosyltransferase [Desulfatibacillaceae bacterium]